MIWRCFGQQEVVLEYSSVSTEDAAVAVSFGMAACLGSCVLDVLHEAALCFIHCVVLGRVLFIWVVESRSCGVWAGAEVACVYVLSLLHQYYAVVLEASLIEAAAIVSAD